MGRWLRCSRSGALRTDVHLSEIQKVFTKQYPKRSQGGLLFFGSWFPRFRVGKRKYKKSAKAFELIKTAREAAQSKKG